MRRGPDADGTEETVRVPAGATTVTTPFIASVWQVDARPGMRVAKGDKLAALEAMKMETITPAPHAGAHGVRGDGQVAEHGHEHHQQHKRLHQRVDVPTVILPNGFGVPAPCQVPVVA